MKSSFLGDERGFSLISVIVALGLAGILAGLLTEINVNSMRNSKQIKLQDELTQVRQMVLKRLSCKDTLNITSATLLPIACPNTITLKDRHGRSLFATDGRVGNSTWYVSPSCNASGIQLKVTRLTKDKKPALNPLTKKRHKLEPLFETGDFTCSEYFLGTAGNSCISGSYVSGIKPDGSVECRPLAKFSNTACPANEFAKGFSADGSPICQKQATPKIVYRQCHWNSIAMNCENCIQKCPNDKVVRELRVNFRGMNSGTGNLEMNCCMAKAVFE